jgi:malonate-semialdehyde dehydrogenase (acetylating) / methylmalonate-semialdehyde dehydrogenase
VIANLIGSEHRLGAAGANTLPVFNPATGEVIDHVPMSGAEDVAVAVEVASCAYRTWSKTAVLERVRPDVPLQGVAR